MGFFFISDNLTNIYIYNKEQDRYMDKKSILKEIKKLITFSNEELNFLDAKLNDGITIVRVEADNFAEGLPLLVVTPDGLIPAPTGEHTLEDGTIIVVDEGGLITNITTPEAEVETPQVVEEDLADEEPVVDEEVEIEEKQVEEDMGYKIKEMEARIAELEKLTSEIIPMMKETAEFGTNVISKLDTFVKETPAQIEFKSIKAEYKSFVEGKKEKAISGLEGIKTIRKK